MKTKGILFLMLAYFIGQAQAQSPVWAKQLSGTSNSEVKHSELAPNGDLYSVGTFSGTVDFDFGPGEQEFTSQQNRDQFILRTNSEGDFVSAIQLSGSGFINDVLIAADVNSSIYVAGRLDDSFDFDPSSGTVILDSEEQSTVFLAKYDQDLNFVWASKMGSSDYVDVKAIAVDNNPDVYLATYLSSSLSVNGQVDASDLGSTFRGSLLKFSGNDGLLEWSGYLSENAIINDMATNAEGQLITTGEYFASCDVDLDPNSEIGLSANASRDVFLSVYNPDRSHVQSTTFGASGFDTPRSIAVDSDGNIILVGEYTIQINCDPTGESDGILTTQGFTDGCFIAKFDSDFNFIWQKQVGRSADTYMNDVTTDAANAVWFVGQFSGTANFHPDNIATPENLTANGEQDGFVCQFDSDGNFLQKGAFTGSWYEENPTSIEGNINGTYYISGSFNLDMDVDPSNDQIIFNSLGGYDSFIIRFDGFAVSAPSISNRVQLIAYPNPTSGIISIQTDEFTGAERVEVRNLLGEEIPVSITRNQNSINLHIPGPSGLYLLQTSWADGSKSVTKVVKQ